MSDKPRDVFTKFASEAAFTVRLREIMQERGISQAKLSKMLESTGHPMHQSAISKILNPAEGQSRRTVSIDDFLAIARALEVRPLTMLIPDKAMESTKASQLLAEALDLIEKMDTMQAKVAENAISLGQLASENDEVRQMLISAVATAEADRSDPESRRASFFREIQKMLNYGKSDGQ